MNLRGFSLIEIAVVLVIISVLIGIVAIPLATQVEQQRITDTNKQLEAIKEAIIGYVLANGRFPCPSQLTDNGVESLNGPASNGLCNTNSGYVPAVTLGLSPVDSSGFVVDAWGLSQNRIRYFVKDLTIPFPAVGSCTNTAQITHVLTKTDGMKSATMTCLADTNAAINMLTVVSTTITNVPQGCSPLTLTAKAPFVLISNGKNAPTGGTGADETPNASTSNATTTFVSHTPTQAGSCADEFDDLVTWPSINTIFARMVQAGKLP